MPDIEEIREFYDSVYHADASAGEEKSMRRHYLGLFRRLQLRKDQQLLDVACGTGGWMSLCSEMGLQVAGVDLSRRAIEACALAMPEGEFYAQPAESLPFDSGRFDVVTCLGSLEHFVDPVASLREMLRVAKPDARASYSSQAAIASAPPRRTRSSISCRISADSPSPVAAPKIDQSAAIS